ncbi:molybdopterin synthase subunit MoaE [Candidatus Thermokryptus mobilis]|uniref:Molybdopterin synthase catalytic subunit n=1 Tax=Candidatus Thermokryptus mobilis TaxID=1643428 RepID=A0A0S4N3Y7_9BACT|nr:molybdenum cofactor biosynthesis protein MoaE [Candidatus Thermokryptus mobilis]CUU04705.1 molybdopterin synthase subunit MoaE [Candidatus Thermokryptus mobilis]
MYLTKEKINLDEILRGFDFGSGKNGSVIIFTGIVRGDEVKSGEFVESIFYDAYEQMAEREIEKIKNEARSKFPIDGILIRHRIGNVGVGEISFVVVVSSAHREEGFRAIQFIIDEVKSKVPIWKKEILSNGKTIWR